MKLVTGLLVGGIAALSGYVGYKAYKSLYPSTEPSAAAAKRQAPTIQVPIDIPVGAFAVDCERIINSLSDAEGFKYTPTTFNLDSTLPPVIYSMRSWAKQVYALGPSGPWEIAANWLASEAAAAETAGAPVSYVKRIRNVEKCLRDLGLNQPAPPSKYSGFTPAGPATLGVGKVAGSFCGSHPALNKAMFGKRVA